MIFLATSWKLILEPVKAVAAEAAASNSDSRTECDEQVEVGDAATHCTRADLMRMKTREARGR